jgi:hypothetical protein
MEDNQGEDLATPSQQEDDFENDPFKAMLDEMDKG